MKRVWTPEEDAELMKHINDLGESSKWSQIGRKMSSRTAKQCRERFYNHLKGDLRKGNWGSEEDAMICRMKYENGGQWAKIARQIPGRSENSIKNRWHLIQRNKNIKTRQNNPIQQHFLKDKASVAEMVSNNHINGTNPSERPTRSIEEGYCHTLTSTIQSTKITNLPSLHLTANTANSPGDSSDSPSDLSQDEIDSNRTSPTSNPGIFKFVGLLNLERQSGLKDTRKNLLQESKMYEGTHRMDPSTPFPPLLRLSKSNNSFAQIPTSPTRSSVTSNSNGDIGDMWNIFDDLSNDEIEMLL